jgi:hypothetical protein
MVSLNLLGAGTRVITNALAPGGGSPLHSGGLKPATIPNRDRSDAQFLPVGRSSDHPFQSMQHKHTAIKQRAVALMYTCHSASTTLAYHESHTIRPLPHQEASFNTFALMTITHPSHIQRYHKVSALKPVYRGTSRSTRLRNTCIKSQTTSIIIHMK